MASLDELRDARLAKLKKLQEAGINPYPAKSNRTHSVSEALLSFSAPFWKKPKNITVGGRVLALRGQGAVVFCDIFDGTGKIQALFKKDGMDAKDFILFKDTVDIGDFVEVSGTPFLTKRKEKTITVSKWTMLAKSLLPLPDKWHGLTDPDERFRKRYLDMLMDEEVRDVIRLRSEFWSFIRSYVKNEGFLEVDTPTLEHTTGGAEARPFKTHHNDLDVDLFLRISVGELWQKRMLAGGFPRVFEIGRAYRNEGTSPEHLQEFTNFEMYAGYMDLDEGIMFTEKMLKGLVKQVFKKEKFTIRGHEVDFGGKWEKIDYISTVKKMTGIDLMKATEEEMKSKLSELKVEYDGKTRERLIDTLWKYCRKQIAGPVWLVGHPKIVSPLSKTNPDNPELTLRMQLILAGAEACNGFAELNDPIDQRKRFEEQQKLIEKGDDEAMMPDWEFVEMLEHGMPPAFGLGLGDRLFSFLVDKPIRETQAFPLSRPKE